MAIFTIQDGLSEKQRAKILLFKKDDPLQQSYVFNNAKSVFTGNVDGIQEEIIPLILSNVLKWSEDIQVLAGDMFDSLLRDGILLESLKAQIKVTCLEMIKIWSQRVLLAWVNVYMRLEPGEKEFSEITFQMSQRN